MNEFKQWHVLLWLLIVIGGLGTAFIINFSRSSDLFTVFEQTVLFLLIVIMVGVYTIAKVIVSAFDVFFDEIRKHEPSNATIHHKGEN